MIKFIVGNEEICYVCEEIDAPRGIRSKGRTKEKEVIIIGFNRKKRPDLFEKYMKKAKLSRSDNIEKN